jgi:hypothetical protein
MRCDIVNGLMHACPFDELLIEDRINRIVLEHL